MNIWAYRILQELLDLWWVSFRGVLKTGRHLSGEGLDKIVKSFFLCILRVFFEFLGPLITHDIFILRAKTSGLLCNLTVLMTGVENISKEKDYEARTSKSQTHNPRATRWGAVGVLVIAIVVVPLFVCTPIGPGIIIVGVVAAITLS